MGDLSDLGDYRLVPIVGRSGRVWIIDEREHAAIGALTSSFHAWPQDRPDQEFWAQRALGGSDEWEAECEHLRQAWKVGQLPPIASSPFIHAPIDLADPFDVYLISERAETTLSRTLRERPLGADEAMLLEQRLRPALDVLHGLSLVHCDVREDNVFRVGGEWKLGDLGGVVEFGEPMSVVQTDDAYRPLGLRVRDPANPENDLYALDVLLRRASV